MHGEVWRSVHGRYFDDPLVARPFLDEIVSSFEISRPDTIADIGGGTGFILRQISELDPGLARLVNVDASQEQLEACRDANLRKVCRSVMDLDRGQLTADGSLTLISRSVLHYFGREGQQEFLEKLRSLLRPGEVFVHQPACFEMPERTACMNDVYRIMGLNKSYLAPRGLDELHRRAGFEILRSRPGPPLDMRSEDLAVRYHLDARQIDDIIAAVREYGLDRDGTFELGPGRFRTAFTYRIMTLRAV